MLNKKFYFLKVVYKMDFPERIDISKFLPSNYEQPDLLEALERETPVRVSNLNGLLDLPVNPNYTGS